MAIRKPDGMITDSTRKHAKIKYDRNPLQSAADQASQWSDMNSYTLNTSKSQVLTFRLIADLFTEYVAFQTSRS